MPDPTVTPAAPAAATVSFTLADATQILDGIASTAAVINPAAGGAIAAIDGLVHLIENTIIPAIRNAHDVQLSVASQALLKARSDALRAQVGAPPAP